MAYDEALAARLRSALRDEPGVVEKKMFGGVAFMVSGSMACGVVGDEIMVRAARTTTKTPSAGRTPGPWTSPAARCAA